MSADQRPTHPYASAAGPDQLAVFRGRRFRVLPAEAERPAGGRPGPLSGGPDELVFELRRRGALIGARQRGAAEAGTELEHLREWARGQGCELELGSPLPRPPARDRPPLL